MSDHGRSKYKREVPCIESPNRSIIDVYSVLVAFNVTCPARAHAVKKLLCAGIRGKGDSLQDLQETKVAVERAIQLEQKRTEREKITEARECIIAAKNPGVEITNLQDPPPLYGCGWRVYAVHDHVLGDKKIVGYRVGWPVKSGGAFLVRHYMAADDERGGPSIDWCLNAAERDAKAFNEMGKRPEEYPALQNCGLSSEDLV